MQYQMTARTDNSDPSRYSPAYATVRRTSRDTLSTFDGRRIHFAVMAIESGARNLGITSREMHDRLKKQNLIHTRLIGRYDLLHTQSREWVADDIVEALENWEAGR